ncbi:DUF5641 domain-containing protein [Trichonephila clavipes]|nr:DUF5641 domain-containing protein [Trichonephila clavipes]
MSRRGKCSDIFTDNATNFVGVNSQLKAFYKTLNFPDQNLAAYFTEEGIEWNFISPFYSTPFTWAKIAGNMPDRIRFGPIYTTTRHFADSKCRSVFCSRFRPGTLGVKCGAFSNSPMMHCARDSFIQRWLLFWIAHVG